jgi:hypothetical protein
MTGEEAASAAQGHETNDIVADLLGGPQESRGAEPDRQPRDEVNRNGESERPDRSRKERGEGAGDESDGEADDSVESELADAEGEEDAEGVADDDGEEHGEDDEAHGGKDTLEGLSAKQLVQRVQALLKAGNVKAALKLATGQDPASFEINEAKYTAFRQHEARERAKTRTAVAKLQENRQTFQAEVQRTVQALQPYAKFAEAAKAYRDSGDTRHVRAIVEGLMGKPYNDAQKALLSDEKRSPGEQALLSKIESLQAKLDELAGARQKPQDADPAEVERRDIEWLGAQVQQMGDPELAAIPNVAKRIRRVILANRHPTLGFQVGVEEAAQRVKEGERRRVTKSPFFKAANAKPAGDKPAKPTAPLRRDSRQSAAPVGEESQEDIIRDLIAQANRRAV